MSTHYLPLNGPYQIKLDEPSRVALNLKILAFAFCCSGFYTYGGMTSGEKYEKVLVEAKAVAFTEGRDSMDLKSLLISDQDTANKACTAWWFGMNTTERKLKK